MNAPGDCQFQLPCLDLRRFAHSLLSGYVQLGVNSLVHARHSALGAALPCRDEFGLWMPLTRIAGYIALMDFGLSAAAARILIDYKDNQKPEEYGGIIQTGGMGRSGAGRP